MKRILVTGANGFLASRIIEYYKNTYQVTGIGRSEVDITEENKVLDYFRDKNWDFVIHCGAISDIPTCEKNPELSYKINVEGTRIIAKASQSIGAKMIFCSSDQVYQGNGIEILHKETEILCPPHVYGKQKCMAEEIVSAVNDNFISLRLSMMYAAEDRDRREHGNFFKTFMESIKEGRELCYPIYDARSITDVWDVVKNLERVFTLPGGVYNFGSDNSLSTYALMEHLLRGTKFQNLITKNQNLFQDEPRNLRMNFEKIKEQGIYLPHALEALEKCKMKALTS